MDMQFSKLQIIGVTSELGAGTRGASLGLDAMQVASLLYDRSFFKRYPVRRLKTVNDRLYQKSESSYAKRLDGIATMYDRIEKALHQELSKKHLPILISGDHSSAGGTIAGIKKAFPNLRLGVVWVDAHADLHSPYTSPSGNVHGMPLATALHEDNLEMQNNQPSEETIWYWNEMKGSNPRVRPEDLFFIGVRSTEAPEEALMAKYGIPNLSVEQVRAMGVEAAAKKAQAHLQECDLLYVSFDVDSMDPSVSVGTGTPVPHGFSESEASDLLFALLQDPRLVAFETVEVNPLLDLGGNSMAEAAFRIFKRSLERIEDQHIKRA